MWLSGLHLIIDKTYEIYDGVFISPINLIPNKEIANKLIQDDNPFKVFQPNLVKFKEYKVKRNHYDEAESSGSPKVEETIRLDDIRLLISILNNKNPCPTSFWQQLFT